MKRLSITFCALVIAMTAAAQSKQTVASPNGRTVVNISSENGKVRYDVQYDGKQVILPSKLGLSTSIGDYSDKLTFVEAKKSIVNDNYLIKTVKKSKVAYSASKLTLTYENDKKGKLDIIFQVSDNNVAFRYKIYKNGEQTAIIVDKESTSFRLPDGTTTFICPQSDAMVGWKNTKPSYEEEYKADAPMTEKSKYSQGYTFPCLFHLKDAWALISETGTNNLYPGCHLSDYNAADGYSIAFPMKGENNGIGITGAGMQLDAETPWRTITVGESLKPIVETTIAYDVVEPQYYDKTNAQPGRYTWSWLIWQDKSINYDDQVKFIDTAAEMGYEYCLVDNWWDSKIGRDKMQDLAEYAKKKGVSLMLWYNSNGYENNAPQTPKNCLNTAAARHKEMQWLKSIGVKGIKVDFFGGDKQITMQLYEDILADANEYGIAVIFHGCTLPRGWERMYPNFISSEAVLASENTYFSNYHAKKEAIQLTTHPFCRNTVATMDWGGTIMNKYMSKDNKSRHQRYTTDVFEMAAGIINQAAIQCIAIQPNNLQELPQWELDWLKTIPTAWADTKFIDGYPSKFVIMARKKASDGKWIVAGLNAESKEKQLTIQTPFEKGTKLTYLNDYGKPQTVKAGNNGEVKIKMKTNGGFILQE